MKPELLKPLSPDLMMMKPDLLSRLRNTVLTPPARHDRTVPSSILIQALQTGEKRKPKRAPLPAAEACYRTLNQREYRPNNWLQQYQDQDAQV